MDRLLQECKFATRLLWKDRAFSATAILTLAICIGANVAIFAVVNAVLLQPLPVPHAEQLVHMYNAYPGAGLADGSGATGVPDYFDRLRETDVFKEQSLYNTRGVTLGDQGDPQRIVAMMGTPSLLRLLEVQPIRGRIFTEEDGELGKTHKAVLTYASWQQWFGGREDAVGRDVRINGEPYTVVGILPQGFGFLEPDVKVFLPLAFTAEEKSDESRHSNNWSYVARLKPGATEQQARQQIDALNARNLDRFPNLKQILINAGFHTVVVPLQAYLVRDLRNTLYLLWGGVIFVLLIGGVNVTNLMLIRSSGRMKELATRHALGAGLVRIASQIVTESLLLTLIGGAIGLGLGMVGVRLLGRFGLDATPQGTAVLVDRTVIAFTFALAVVGRLPGQPDPHLRRPPHEPGAGDSRRRAKRNGGPARQDRSAAAGHRAGGVRVHAADRRRTAARQLPAHPRRQTGIRRQPRADRDREPAAGAIQRGSAAHRVLEPASRSRRGVARSRSGRHHEQSAALRRLQRQRDPRRRLRDDPWGIADLTLPRVDLAWLLRGHEDPAPARALLHGIRRRAGAQGGDRRRAPREAVLEGRRSARQEDVEARVGRGTVAWAGSQEPLLHRCRRCRQHTRHEPHGEGAGRHVLLSVSRRKWGVA